MQEQIPGGISVRTHRIMQGIMILQGILFRILMLPFRSDDFNLYFLPWIQAMRKEGGLASLHRGVTDYTVPYTFFLTLLSYLSPDIHNGYLFGIKLFSCFFDVLLSFAAGLIVYELTQNKIKAGWGAVLTFLLPTVLIDSSVWGQCDQIYATFCLLFVLFLFREKPYLSMLFFSIAFAVKLQTVFLIPVVFLGLWLRKIPWKTLLMIPVVYVISTIPALLEGRPLMQVCSIYLDQTGEYPMLTINFPNIYCLFYPKNTDIFGKYGLLTTVMLLGILFYLTLLKSDRKKADSKALLHYAILMLMTIVIFLPYVHERYGFVLNILLAAAAVAYPEDRIRALVWNFISMISYFGFVPRTDFLKGEHLSYLAIPVLVIWWLYLRDLIRTTDLSETGGFAINKLKAGWSWIETVFCLTVFAIAADRLLATRLFRLKAEHHGVGKTQFTLLGKFLVQMTQNLPLSEQHAFYALKLLAFMGDVAIAVFAGMLVYHLTKSRQKGILTYAVCMVLPVVGWASAAWAGIDTICVALVLAGIWLILKDKKVAAMICLGLVCSLQIQYWMIFPALLILPGNKKINWKQLIILPAVYLISLVPAVISGAGSLREGFDFFFSAVVKKLEVSNGSLGIYQVMGFAEIWHKSGSYWVLASMVCGIGACLVLLMYLYEKAGQMNVEMWILSLTVFCMIFLFFFPFLHERDGMLPSMLLVILAFTRKEAAGWAACSQIILWLAYCTRVSDVIVHMPALSVLQGVLLMFLVWKLLFWTKNECSYDNYIQT